MPEIKRVAFTNSRARTLHIEAPGCIINVRKGLHNSEGAAVTSVEIICDQYAGERPWSILGIAAEGIDVPVANLRVVEQPLKTPAAVLRERAQEHGNIEG